MQAKKKNAFGINKYYSRYSKFLLCTYCYADHSDTFRLRLKQLIIFKALWNPTISPASQINDTAIVCRVVSGCCFVPVVERRKKL